MGRTIGAIASALVVAAIGVFALMPAMSNGGWLSGREFFGMLGVGALCVASFYFIVKAQPSGRVMLWVQAVVVGMSAPFLVLVAPLAFCILFRPGASCV